MILFWIFTRCLFFRSQPIPNPSQEGESGEPSQERRNKKKE
ncbi:hypothetical protein [Okeania sp. SIO2B9]|nr:hypothetical protein [Okeania sp. SIO2B9]